MENNRRRNFFERFARQKKFDPRIPENWYPLRKEDFATTKVNGKERSDEKRREEKRREGNSSLHRESHQFYRITKGVLFLHCYTSSLM